MSVCTMLASLVIGAPGALPAGALGVELALVVALLVLALAAASNAHGPCAPMRDALLGRRAAGALGSFAEHAPSRSRALCRRGAAPFASRKRFSRSCGRGGGFLEPLEEEESSEATVPAGVPPGGRLRRLADRMCGGAAQADELSSALYRRSGAVPLAQSRAPGAASPPRRRGGARSPGKEC